MHRTTSLMAIMIGLVLGVTGCIVVPVKGAVVHPKDRDARDNRNTKVVRVSPPKVVVYSDDPDLIIIPGTYVYVIDGDDDVYFYRGVWWRTWRNSWYRAEVYHGAWIKIEVRDVPRPVSHIKADWKHRRKDAPRVRWNDTRRNWKRWEDDRHWEKKKWRR